MARSGQALVALAQLLAIAGRGVPDPADAVHLVQQTLKHSQTLDRDAPVVDGRPPLYLSGDGAEVFIETGVYANVWVPCKIMKMNAPGWYDIQVQAAHKKGRTATNVTGVRYNYLRQLTSEEYDSSISNFLANETDKVSMALQVEREAGRRKRAAEAAKRARDYAKEVMAKGCPGEYIITDGNIPLGDQFGRGARNLKPALDQCAKDCDQHKECKAFEWDPVSTVCNLKKTSEPKPGFYDGRYMLCQKFVYEGPLNKTAANASAVVASTTPAAAATTAAVLPWGAAALSRAPADAAAVSTTGAAAETTAAVAAVQLTTSVVSEPAGASTAAAAAAVAETSAAPPAAQAAAVEATTAAAAAPTGQPAAAAAAATTPPPAVVAAHVSTDVPAAAAPAGQPVADIPATAPLPAAPAAASSPTANQQPAAVPAP